MAFGAKPATATTARNAAIVSGALTCPECLLPDLAPLARTPSQKELACVFGITTRHLRRLEELESSLSQPCSRPYATADLWHLFRRRHPKRWNRAEAERLRLTALFTQFEQILSPQDPADPLNDQHSAALLMLRSIAWHDSTHLMGTAALPKLLGENLAQSAREQLRVILHCPRARVVLAHAFFEAALVAESAAVEEPIALSRPERVPLPASA